MNSGWIHAGIRCATMPGSNNSSRPARKNERDLTPLRQILCKSVPKIPLGRVGDTMYSNGTKTARQLILIVLICLASAVPFAAYGAIPPTPTNPSPGTTTSPGPTTASTTVTMSWSASSGATSYGIGVRDMVTNTLVVDTFTSSTSYQASGLTAGRTYRWNVAATNSSGSSAYTTPLYFTTPSATAIPPTPTNPSPGTTTSPGPTTASTTVTMSWSASSGATSYGIGVRDMTTNTLVVDTFTSSTSYTASNLTAGRTYRWNVAATNSAGTSAYTTPVYFTTPSGPVIPTTPT